MAQTQQVTVTTSPPTPIVAQSLCSIIRVAENRGVAGWPTTDFLVYKGTISATPVRIGAGGDYQFNTRSGSYFQASQTVGWIATVAGTTTFDQDESHY